MARTFPPPSARTARRVRSPHPSPVVSGALSRVVALPAGDTAHDLAEMQCVDRATVRVVAVAPKLLNRQSHTLNSESPPTQAGLALNGLSGLVENRQRAQP